MRAVIAVPVKDEAERIGACLRAMAQQQGIAADAIVLAINNTSDATVTIVRRLLPLLPVPVHVIEHDFPPEQASAGAARRLALERAAGLLDESGVLLTTDADGRVPPDWVAANLHHIAHGADAVAGRAVLDPAEAALIPAALHDDDALECAYAAALDEMAALIDPEPWDPWPRHTEHSGASIAVTLSAYRRAGGMPAAALAEDRRFFAALERQDARIRHAPEIEVVVSGRTLGRAEGGMADTIRRRLSLRDPYLDGALERAADRLHRLSTRASFRAAWQGDAAGLDALAEALRLDRTVIEAAAQHALFGEAWGGLEAASPALGRALVPAGRAQGELETVRRILLTWQQSTVNAFV